MIAATVVVIGGALASDAFGGNYNFPSHPKHSNHGNPYAKAYVNQPMLAARQSAAMAQAPTGKTGTGKPAGKVETYCVVQIDDEVSVIKKANLAGLRKSTAEEDKRAAKEYENAKKEAKKNKEKFDTTKPIPRKVKMLKDGFKSEQDAADWKDKRGDGKEDKPAKKKTY